MKRINLLIFIMFIIVILLSLFYLKNNVMISESNSISYIEDNDIVGSIKIDSIKLSNLLVQGLDNNYYYDHNYLKQQSKSGEIFLDYQGDLINNNNAIIYTKVDNINNIGSIKDNDKIEIFYLYKMLCYKVNNSKNNKDLEIRVINNKKVEKIYAKKVKC